MDGMEREYFARPARLACILAALLVLNLRVAAEQLPLRHYGVAEGLPFVGVQSIFQDSKGYLWLGTAEGVSRFDGYNFTTYDTSDGLAHRFINSIAEDRQGRVWVATNGGGVSCFADRATAPTSARQGHTVGFPRQRFVSFKLSDQTAANRVNALIFDADNRLWCATDAGLFRSTAIAAIDGEIRFEVIVPHTEVEVGMRALADSRGRLWFCIADIIVEVLGDRIITHRPETEIGNVSRSIVEDRQGRLLLSNEHSVSEFLEPPERDGRGTWSRLPLGLSRREPLTCMLADAAGALWIGTRGGLIKYSDGRQTLYTSANGLSDNVVSALAEDTDGNLWIGTEHGGLCMLSAEPVVSFGQPDGLPEGGVTKVLEGQSAHIYAATNSSGLFEVTDRQVLPIRWSAATPFNTITKRVLQDRRGDWWLVTSQGLFRFQGPDLRQGRGRKITPEEGVPDIAILSELYQDPGGMIWFCSYDNILYCLDPTAPKGRLVARRIILDYPSAFGALRMIADRTGGLWIGAQLVLGRVIDGRATMLQPTDGLPETDPRAFFIDSRGWLWIGLRNKGVSVTKDPAATPIEFSNYSTENGLASNSVWSITEDDFGRIYLGTGRGLDRLDPSSGLIQHITAGERLGGEVIAHCIKDSRGFIWVASISGLTRLDPRAGPSAGRAPPIYLTRLQIAGEDFPMPDTGAAMLPSMTLAPSRNNLLIEYVGLDFHSGRELRYQYKLDGVDVGWSPLTDQRSVNYASLAAGSYKFMVRAVNQDGMASPEPAVIQVRVLPPVWRRWWFIGLAALLLAVTAYSAHRLRVSQLVGLERVRTHIAADLHDDIGSGLSKIAIMSDVASHLLPSDDLAVKEPLSVIAATSRELVDSMSDIVWAVNPDRDRLQDLIQRMRRFANDIFSARNIAFSFDGPAVEPTLRIGTDVRRQILLIFKEGINNIARHSECQGAQVGLNIKDGWILMELADDGKGFDPTVSRDGNGLASMRARAARLGGDLQITSAPGVGTQVRVRASLSAQLRKSDGRSR
jgi:ligand-binding sensor domain-containing protein/signal transduction histidine kinase